MNVPLHPSLFRDSQLLRGLSEDRVVAFLAECPASSYTQPTELLAQGEIPKAVLMVVRGRIEVSHIDADGNPMILHIAGPGEVVGEAEIFCGRACVATCTALPGTTLLHCPPEALLRHIPADLLMRNFSEILHDRLARDINERLIGQFRNPDQRIGHYILQYTSPEAPEIRLNQAYLASLSGCSRQTVNRRLGELRKLGIIEVKRATIRVLDRAALQAETGGSPLF